MVRNHSLFVITFTFHQRVSDRDAYGDQTGVHYEKGLSTGTSRVLAPSKRLAEVWFNEQHGYRYGGEEDLTVTSVEDTGRIDGFIELHQW